MSATKKKLSSPRRLYGRPQLGVDEKVPRSTAQVVAQQTFKNPILGSEAGKGMTHSLFEEMEIFNACAFEANV